MRGLHFQVWLDTTGRSSWLCEGVLLAFPSRTHIWRAIRVDGEPETMHRIDLRVKDFFMTADQTPSEGRPCSWSVFQRCMCSGELPLTRESPQSGWLPTEIWGEGNSGDGPSLLKVPVKSWAPFNYLNISWGNRPREGGYLVGFIKLRAEPYINISFTVISRY